MLDFNDDAIILSGETGTKLKCDILSKYYQLWWNITSGGNREYKLATTIVELNAGTCENYLEDTGETILGSSGHALELKKNSNTNNLSVILVEENDECYHHLKNVIKRKWPNLDIDELEGPIDNNKSNVYLIHNTLNDALDTIEKIRIRNSLFFFDPLLSTSWSQIERVAANRIKYYYQINTEFIVFLFSSDWFKGRGELIPLPSHNDELKWTSGEKETIEKMDKLFGSKEWRSQLLTLQNNDEKIDKLIFLYKKRLNKWFRYVCPLPFEPKPEQMYHLFICTNYESIDIVRRFYSDYTNNPKYSPNNPKGFKLFRTLHPQLFRNISGSKRPFIWNMLWTIIKNHHEGICDIRCQDLREKQDNWKLRKIALQWLHANDYLELISPMTDAWEDSPPQYKINWDTLKNNLEVARPEPLRPLSPK